MNTRTLTPEQLERTAKAMQLHAKLAAVDITEIPTLTLDRCISRKDQAKLARELFRKLGLKGISVTAPNYSMASTVDVSLPKRCDHDMEIVERDGNHGRDPAHQANCAAGRRIEAILLAAFPQHDDRSDYGADYSDRCWSVNS
jgi:hypothetical protein